MLRFCTGSNGPNSWPTSQKVIPVLPSIPNEYQQFRTTCEILIVCFFFLVTWMLYQWNFHSVDHRYAVAQLLPLFSYIYFSPIAIIHLTHFRHLVTTMRFQNWHLQSLHKIFNLARSSCALQAIMYGEPNIWILPTFLTFISFGRAFTDSKCCHYSKATKMTPAKNHKSLLIKKLSHITNVTVAIWIRVRLWSGYEMIT